MERSYTCNIPTCEKAGVQTLQG